MTAHQERAIQVARAYCRRLQEPNKRRFADRWLRYRPNGGPPPAPEGVDAVTSATVRDGIDRPLRTAGFRLTPA